MDYSTAKNKLRLSEKNLYSAGYPGFERNFSRDGFIYGLLASDKDALLAQINYSSGHQGKQTDPATGEEPGKIHHEFPAGEWRGRPTTYNACDSTALYLLAVNAFATQTEDFPIEEYMANILEAVSYIKSHVRENLFFEDPTMCGAKDFAVRVTYWKDSVLVSDHEEPHYPIIYTLVHFQCSCALQRIGKLLGDRELMELGHSMKQHGIEKLWNENHFVTASDDCIIDNLSSDSLHALLYIEPDELPKGYAKLIQKYSRQLETPAGYMSGLTGYNSDVYHTRYVWVFEQALLHAAAKKHSLNHVSDVAERVVRFMGDSFPELIDTKDEKYQPAGNDPQLWSLGAYKYFSNSDISLVRKI